MKKKQSIAVIGPNPIQSNPWMDPIHVQLWFTYGFKGLYGPMVWTVAHYF